LGRWSRKIELRHFRHWILFREERDRRDVLSRSKGARHAKAHRHGVAVVGEPRQVQEQAAELRFTSGKVRIELRDRRQGRCLRARWKRTRRKHDTAGQHHSPAKERYPRRIFALHRSVERYATTSSTSCALKIGLPR